MCQICDLIVVLANKSARKESDSSTVCGTANDPSSTELPSPGSSSSPCKTPSPASQKSHASSFAYLAHDNRGDKRLFKKRSKPLEHLQKLPSLSNKSVELKHSASYYKPKVVEDSAESRQPATAGLDVPVATGSKSPAAQAQSTAQIPIRKPRFESLQSEPSTTIPLPPPTPTENNAGDLWAPMSPGPKSTRLAPRHLHFETFPESRSRSRDSSQSRRHRQAGLASIDPSATSTSVDKWSNHLMTPLESEPTDPFDSMDNHGEHYFRTFGTDTIYQKTSPSPSPTRPKPTEDIQPTRTSPRPVATKMHSEASSLSLRSLKGSGIFNVSRTRSPAEIAFDLPNSSIVERSPTPSTPGIKVAPSHSPISRRKSHNTSDFLGSYFPSRRTQKKSSEALPGSEASTLPTHWEDIMAESQPTAHVKELSDPLSPLSVPQQPIRPKPKRADDKIRSVQTSRQLPTESIVPVVPSGAITGPQPKYKSAHGEEYYKASLTGPGALSFLPSEMTRVNTPPLRYPGSVSKKPSGFKGFFFDMRSIPIEQEHADTESPDAASTKRRPPIKHRSSLQTLLPKLSLPKLKHKPSHQIQEEQQHPPDPLAVTGFHQTPYSQRYGDTRRAKMSRIQSYVDEALEAEDDESTSFPFELNVPDHLPNSPLCPLNPKHKSGGRAICPIHRRRKTKVAMPSKISGKSAHNQGPRIVFESEQAEGRSGDTFKEFRRKRSRES